MRTIGDDVIAVGAIAFGGLVCTGLTLWCLEQIPTSRAPALTEAPRAGPTIDHAIIRDLSEQHPEAIGFAVIRDINEPMPGAVAFAITPDVESIRVPDADRKADISDGGERRLESDAERFAWYGEGREWPRLRWPIRVVR